MSNLRLGVVDYHNTLPLASSLEQFLPGVEITRALPAALALKLEQGALDAGLVPVAALARNPEWDVVPGIGIACRGAVGSVALLSRESLANADHLVPDPASRTSNVLAQIWLRHCLGRTLPLVEAAGPLAERLRPGAVTVSIGDEALFFDEPVQTKLDLGEAWHAWTGLPFVFAVWAGPKASNPDLAQGLQACLSHNSRRLEELARGAETDPAKTETIRRYLTEYVSYRLEEAETKGLNLYLQYAAEAGLLPGVSELQCHATLSEFAD